MSILNKILSLLKPTPRWEDFKGTGATYQESRENYERAMGVFKPSFDDYRYSGETAEESGDKFQAAMDEYRRRRDQLPE